MASMFSVYGWTSAVVADQPISSTSLLLDVTLFLFAVVAVYALHRHLSTRGDVRPEGSSTP